jgi:hypothetical protein
MFQPFPKLTRFSQDWTVTEKIDGSNAQIFIDPYIEDIDRKYVLYNDKEYCVYAGSRSRFLTADKHGDHMGFAKWVQKYAEELVNTLGPGRHYGEWWGQGIQRGYDLKEKRFSLFNVSRWKEEEVNKVPFLHVVPTLSSVGFYLRGPDCFEAILDMLKETGSKAAPGYMNPEGIVMHHGRSGTLFKKTFDYDEEGKWKELQNAA